MTNATLALTNVYKSYAQAGQSVFVLQGVSAIFDYGKSYAITGVSGSGKSTLMYILAGLDMPTRGVVLYNGSSINAMDSSEKAHFLNSSIGVAFQYPYLIKELTVLENVMIKGMIAQMSRDLCFKNAQELLVFVGLADHMNYYPGQLSGGQQQRVALARALMNNPSFLIADEPTANLDGQTGALIIDLIMRLQQEKGMGVIISSHDAYVTKRMQMAFVLENGLLARQR